ncbi:hypothetical protein KJQ97_09405, partial [Campylobacter sp. 2018MI01]|uniref:hypothetical protein n=1 Tax=Campylobacter sp. 2018MI01 TaxID=2836735 RepID=UPI001BDAE4CD
MCIRDMLCPPWISFAALVLAVVCFFPLRSVVVTTVTAVLVFVSQLFGEGGAAVDFGFDDFRFDDSEKLLPPWISFDDVVMAVVCFLPLRSVVVTSVTYVRVFVSQLYGEGGAAVDFGFDDFGFDDGEQLLPPWIAFDDLPLIHMSASTIP